MDVTDLSMQVGELARQALAQTADLPVRADSVTLGLTPARLLLQDDAQLHALLAGGFKALATLGGEAQAVGLRDAAGHRRAIYHPLVLHLHLAAFERVYETMDASFWSICEDALPDALAPCRSVEDFADVAPPGDQIDLVLWNSLCVLEQASLLSRDVDVELIDGVVHSVLSGGPSASSNTGAPLHAHDPDESLDTWTYRELTALHALANLALRRRNESWARRVQQVALHHLHHTQPDFFTYEPWALFAFAWSPSTAAFAQQQMHDVSTHLATGNDKVAAALLLADAAAAMAQFD